MGRALDGMQLALETETKAKVEALRMKKKLEADVVDLHTALEHANGANAELQRNIKMIQTRIREAQTTLDEETRAKSAAQDEDRKNSERMQALVDQLQSKIRSYKK